MSNLAPSLCALAPEQCDTCGSIGAERWHRSDGIEVCDECWWLEGQENPEPLPVRPLLRYRPRHVPRARHAYCFTCSTIFWNRTHRTCPRCSRTCTSLTDTQLARMERHPVICNNGEKDDDEDFFERRRATPGTKARLQSDLERARANRKIQQVAQAPAVREKVQQDAQAPAVLQTVPPNPPVQGA